MKSAQRFHEDLDALLLLKSYYIVPEVIEDVLDDWRKISSMSRILRNEDVSCLDPSEKLEKLYFRQDLPARTTALLMREMGCRLDHENLKYASYFNGIANPEVFIPLLVKQHSHLNDFSLYRFMPKLVDCGEVEQFLLLASKYMGFDRKTHPHQLTENLCRWGYTLSLACSEKDRFSLDSFFFTHADRLLAGLEFTHLIEDPLALGMAQHFHGLGLKPLSSRYTLAQRSWPQIMEHFSIVEELGHPVDDDVLLVMKGSSAASKKFALASLYFHLSKPGSSWVGFDVAEKDQANIIARAANKLWDHKPEARRHIAHAVNEMASVSVTVAEGLMAEKLDGRIAKQCNALMAGQLERDLGL